MSLNKVVLSPYAQEARQNLLRRGVRSIYGRVEPEDFMFAPYVDFEHDALRGAIFDLKLYIGHPDDIECSTWLVEANSRGSNVADRALRLLGFADLVIGDSSEGLSSFVHVRLNGVLVSVATLGKKSPDPVKNS